MREEQGRAWVTRVVNETPRIAQLLFQLPRAPESPYNTTGRYPDWIGSVQYERFTWTRVSDREYRAVAAAVVAPGPGMNDLAGATPLPASVRAELTVSFTVHVTPPPIFFLPAGKSLQPMRWTLHRVDDRTIEESGGYVSYQ